jgi:hypothetical protein
MNSLKDLFTPLDKKYCVYFYYISVISFCFFIFIFLTATWCLVFETKKINLIFCMNSVSLMISTFLAYFVNRLMYSMCVKSI